MIGSDADYVSTVAAKLPGQTWAYYMDELPLCIGMQLRNADLFERGCDIVPPGRSASAKMQEILGEHAEAWFT